MVIPTAIDELVEVLARMPGAVAVVLGGSRALGVSDEGSDWDLGVYYRGALDTAALAALGTVHPPGAWGRIMNGGAWLTHAGMKVDVILRDLDAVEHWTERAREGQYDVDLLLGYLAGIPTYTLLTERAVARMLRGTLPPAEAFPARLAETAPERWRFHSRFSFAYARMLAARGDHAGTLGPGGAGRDRARARAPVRAARLGAQREADPAARGTRGRAGAVRGGCAEISQPGSMRWSARSRRWRWRDSGVRDQRDLRCDGLIDALCSHSTSIVGAV